MTLTCLTSNGNPPTVHKYSWSKDGQIRNRATSRIIQRNPIEYNQGGRYSCSATNAAGTSSAEIDIDVKYKPRLNASVTHQRELVVALGANVTLTLTILSNPDTSDVQWTKDGSALGQRSASSNLGLTDILSAD